MKLRTEHAVEFQYKRLILLLHMILDSNHFFSQSFVKAKKKNCLISRLSTLVEPFSGL